MLGEPFTPNRSLVGPDRVHHEYVFSDPYWYAESCHMCPDLSEGGKRVSPACVANCPRGAAQIAQPGHPMYGDLPVRFIDQELCVGCGICVDRCPYGHPLLLLAAARKCDLCLGHPDFTGVPACVEQCPASALLYLDYPATAAPRPFPWEQSA
jgi:Fe-S-cluster-containing dehydrogenase component